MGRYYCAFCETSHPDFKTRVQCPVCSRYYCKESVNGAKSVGRNTCPYCDTKMSNFRKESLDFRSTSFEKSIIDTALHREGLMNAISETITIYGRLNIPLLRLVQHTQSDLENVQKLLWKLIVEGRIKGRIEDKGTLDASDDILTLDENWNFSQRVKEDIDERITRAYKEEKGVPEYIPIEVVPIKGSHFNSKAVEWIKRAVAFNNRNNHEEAIKALNRAIEIAPNYNVPLYLKGRILQVIGREDEAKIVLTKARKLD